jgi:hypothetical protein
MFSVRRIILRIQRARSAFDVIVLATLALALVGCNVNPPRSDVVGRYELRGIKSGQITLTLREDGSWIEQIHWTSNRTDARSGQWSLRSGCVALNDLWIPKEFVPADVLKSDEFADPSQPKFTDPGNWVLSPEKWWGVVTMDVFPDEEVEFRKVSGS